MAYVMHKINQPAEMGLLLVIVITHIENFLRDLSWPHNTVFISSSFFMIIVWTLSLGVWDLNSSTVCIMALICSCRCTKTVGISMLL